MTDQPRVRGCPLTCVSRFFVGSVPLASRTNSVKRDEWGGWGNIGFSDRSTSATCLRTQIDAARKAAAPLGVRALIPHWPPAPSAITALVQQRAQCLRLWGRAAAGQKRRDGHLCRLAAGAEVGFVADKVASGLIVVGQSPQLIHLSAITPRYMFSRYAVAGTDAGLRPKRVSRYASSSNSAFASFRSGASIPSVNQL